VVGWTVLGAGTLAAVGGGVALLLNGRKVGCMKMEDSMCVTELRENTTVPAGILFGAAGALLIAGGVVLYLQPAPPAATSTGLAAPQGLILGATGRF
jgi:hypothetical protein